MIGTLKKIELRECQTKDKKQKFKIVEFTCDVKVDDKGNIKTLKGSYSEEFAKKYFSYCDVKTKDLIGKDVECVTAKREWENDKGEKRIVTFIRFMNVLDKDGNPIIMPKEGTEELDF